MPGRCGNADTRRDTSPATPDCTDAQLHREEPGSNRVVTGVAISLRRAITTAMRIAAVIAVLLVVASWPRQSHSAAAAPTPNTTPWADMDYGPFMSLTLEAPLPPGNLSNKGIVVPLKPDRSAAMVFDTDLLRWSAGWRGSFIDWKN